MHSVPPSVIADFRHGDLDDVGCELGQSEPPRRGQSATRRTLAESPYRSPNASCVSEGSIIDEVDTRKTATPMSRPLPAVDCVAAKTACLGLGERYDPVVSAEIVVKHSVMTEQRASRFPNPRFVHNRERWALRTVHKSPPSGGGAGPLRLAARALPDPVSRPGRSCATRPRGRRAPPAASSAAGWQGPASPAAARPPAFAPA
jgi:hypothetical protein